MGTFCETIPDLGNGLSGLKGVFDKISKHKGFALSIGQYEGIIQPVDHRYFNDLLGIIAFERQFLIVIT
jgi:hypothetical protein